MKKREVILGIILVVALFLIGIILTLTNQKEEEQKIDNLKDETGAIGDSTIYETQKDSYDGREVLTVKPSIKYKVAFAGMIKKAIPTFEELDSIYQENYVAKNGIWIEKDSKEAMMKILNDKEIFQSQYAINEEGYVIVEKENQANEKDKRLQAAIRGKKQYLISISSICYIVDNITGEILDYSFEDMDKYQIYEYFEDGNKDILFITENKENQLSKEEIINSILDWF